MGEASEPRGGRWQVYLARNPLARAWIIGPLAQDALAGRSLRQQEHHADSGHDC